MQRLGTSTSGFMNTNWTGSCWQVLSSASGALEAVVAKIRETVPPYDQDRFLAPEIAAIKELVRRGAFVDAVPAAVRLSG